MASVRNGSTVRLNGSLFRLIPRRPKRNIRQFTIRRKAKVSLFMEKFVVNVEKYGMFGTAKWMEALISYMKEAPRNGLTTDDVKHWIRTEHYFLKWAMEHHDDGRRRHRRISGLNHVLAKVLEDAKELPNVRVITEAGEKGATEPPLSTVGAAVEAKTEQHFYPRQ